MEDEAFKQRQSIAVKIPMPLRERRYMLEGGLRRRWCCAACGWWCEAHSPEEAREELMSEIAALILKDGVHPYPGHCKHLNPEARGFAPPDDFS